jgi:predicted transcriptional regulator
MLYKDELSITIANNQQFDQFRLLKLKINDLRDGSVNPAVVASTPSTFSYVADELEKLNSLQERGILSQQEFEQQKAKLLS